MRTSIYLFSILLSILACTSKEPTPNRPPGIFTVKSTIGSDGKTIILNWSKSIDPDGDEIAYNVVLGRDTLAKDLKDTLYVIKDLAYDSIYNAIVIAFDYKKLTNAVSLQIATSNLYFSIKDKIFEQYLVSKNYDSDMLVDGKMLKSDAEKVEIINLYGVDVSNIDEISFFKNIIEFQLASYSIDKVDLSKNVKLEKIFIAKSINLGTINLNGLLNLKKIDIRSNNLNEIDFKANTNLEELTFSEDNIAQIDLSKNLKLSKLYCYGKNLTTICVNDIDAAMSNKNWYVSSTATYKICN